MRDDLAVAPEAGSVAVEIDGHCLVLDAAAADDLRSRLGVALVELREAQASD